MLTPRLIDGVYHLSKEVSVLMTYSVKWVKEHLNVTPDMIRRYEDEGLMNKDYYQNPITKRREYSYREIEKLWDIKMYLSMGFTLKQIKVIFEDPNYDFETMLERKLVRLQESYKKTYNCIGLINAVKLLGKVPPRPNNIDEIIFEDYKDNLLRQLSHVLEDKEENHKCL